MHIRRIIAFTYGLKFDVIKNKNLINMLLLCFADCNWTKHKNNIYSVQEHNMARQLASC